MIFDWNEHYKNGGRSGEPEDYIISRNWKQNIILKYCDFDKDSFIDIGCGDLQFWNNKLPKYYTGVDISSVIINKNREIHPESKFITSSASIDLGISSDVVCCFDMLWHIIDDNDYINILKNIKKYSNKYIIIYTWNRNIFDKGLLYRLYTSIVTYKKTKILDLSQIDNDGGYQKYRDFIKISNQIFSPEFTLESRYTNAHWSFGTMYVFRKI